ncbi:hypothetical protein NDU88_005312 [Pleurodeles waltl]|uniref:Uncharacterized protein n=1 Tax=Pleurodeles waltl TaxID=8319 RepID=A0AAV7VMD9_PLEWA|nr:hypothetical protein NDU88_005312 [Pleurodeles waltl]
MLTGAVAAGNNPVLLPWPANPEGLPASKEELGECCGETRCAIKMAACREEALPGSPTREETQEEVTA